MVHTQPVSSAKTLLNDLPFLFIGGEWRPSQDGGAFPTLDPGSGETLTMIPIAGDRDIDAAVKAAKECFQRSPWARMLPNERGVYLHRLADFILRDLDQLSEIESLDVGKPVAQAKWDVEFCAATIRYYSDLAVHTAQREPIATAGHEVFTFRAPRGVCAFIFPWNFPFLLLGWGIAPALAAGNTVVVKPAEDTSLSTLYFTRLVKEAGIPDGVVNVITGPGVTTGAALARHP
jgi:acyl-CoA reductase-like NAD-dependent aldehyde dehydrogenase